MPAELSAGRSHCEIASWASPGYKYPMRRDMLSHFPTIDSVVILLLSTQLPPLLLIPTMRLLELKNSKKKIKITKVRSSGRVHTHQCLSLQLT